MSFIKKSLFVTVGHLLGIFLNMLAGIIFARVLGPNGVGQFEIFRSTQVIIITLFSLGLGNASIYFLNNKNILLTDIVSTTLRFSLFLSLLVSISIIIFIFFVPDYFGEVSLLAIFLFTFGAASLLNSSTLKPILTAKLEATKMVIVDLTPRIVLIFFGSLMLLRQNPTVELALIALGLGNAASFAELIFFYKKSISFKTRFKWDLLKKLLIYGLKLSASNLIYVLTGNVTIILLRIFNQDTFDQVGIYTRAVAISSMVSVIPATIGPMLYAKWSETKTEQLSSQVSYAIRLSIFISFIISVFIVIFSKKIILLMYGIEFLSGFTAVIILAPSLIFFSISNVSINVLASTGNAGLTMKIFAISFLAVGLFSFLLIPILGINGAAIAALAGNIINALLGTWICLNKFNIKLKDSIILKMKDISHIIKSLRI